MSDKKRVLFVVENVTLAQVVRAVTLARALDPRRYEVHFASNGFDELVFGGTRFRRWPIHSIDKTRVEEAIVKGRRIHDLALLSRYVAEERRLMEAVRPHLVVGDLRMSLSISAPLCGVPYAALVNAYWSPFAVREDFPLPDHPIVRMLGVERAAKYFPVAMPRVFSHFAAPVNALRRRHGLSEIGSLQQVLTHGDFTLFPDDPALVPTRGGPPSHRYLGPVQWSPEVVLPSWWEEVDRRRPLVYATLGSSGSLGLVPVVIEALGRLDADVVLTTAGRFAPRGLPTNVRVAPLVPGHLMARRAAVVVSNGGSTTGYQALAEGTPVVGLPFNLDAYLAMTAIRDAGAGIMVRAGTATYDEVEAAVRRAMSDEVLRDGARKVAASFGRHDSASAFRGFVDQVTSASAARAVGHDLQVSP